MSQFAVYLNKNLRSRWVFPMLVDVQSELLQDLETRVVIPLSKRRAFASFPLGVLMPTVELEDETYVLMTPELAGMSRAELGARIGSVASHCRAIAAALDLLHRGF
jgi:toxin CcdB